MATETALDVINRQDWLDPLADTLQKTVHGAYEGAGAPGQAAKNALHGTWLGHPLHPVLTDIPLGAWSTALVLDAMEEITGHREFGHAADVAIGFGLAGAVAAALTGLTDWSDTDGRARKVGLTHGLLNIAGAALYTTSLICRKQNNRAAGRGFSLLGFAGAVCSAWLGGSLVYGEQVGVNHAAGGPPLPAGWTDVAGEHDVAEGAMKRMEANGIPVLLVKRDGQFYAIADTCTHAGGPLHEGKLKGTTVQCPWHMSRFDVRTGEVLDGPATHPAPCFETRVQDGRVQVRSSACKQG